MPSDNIKKPVPPVKFKFHMKTSAAFQPSTLQKWDVFLPSADPSATPTSQPPPPTRDLQAVSELEGTEGQTIKAMSLVSDSKMGCQGDYQTLIDTTEREQAGGRGKNKTAASVPIVRTPPTPTPPRSHFAGSQGGPGCLPRCYREGRGAVPRT